MMPIMFSYNLVSATTDQQNRVQSLFQRFGWENVGGSCYRYPPLRQRPAVEDWLNHVVPALMLFRAFVLKQDLQVNKYSLDAHSSTGHSESVANRIADVSEIQFSQPSNQQFGATKLREWLEGTTESVPY
jgi:hypothetical protein